MDSFEPPRLPSPSRPTHIGFLMVPEYTIITLTNAVGVLRLANRLSGRSLYLWTCHTLTGEPVDSSSHLKLVPDGDVDAARNVDMLFVCAGYDPERQATPTLCRIIEEFAAAGTPLGGLCTGSHLLAAAGALDGYRCAIHWENAQALRETFPSLSVSSSLFVIDRDRYTCSGGVASIDLMLNMVASAHGRELMQGISAQFVLERVRTEEDVQRTPLHYLVGAGQGGRLIEAVALMEANVEEPLSLTELAGYVGISRRQLERLFHVHLHCTPSHYYLDLRLHRGRLLLLQTGATVAEVAARCGFATPARFTKAYTQRYGRYPRDERRGAGIGSADKSAA